MKFLIKLSASLFLSSIIIFALIVFSIMAGIEPKHTLSAMFSGLLTIQLSEVIGKYLEGER